jgi:hypothetical protein
MRGCGGLHSDDSGGFATKAILGLFAIMAQHPGATNDTLLAALENTQRVAFTIGALGTGLAIPPSCCGFAA